MHRGSLRTRACSAALDSTSLHLGHPGDSTRHTRRFVDDRPRAGARCYTYPRIARRRFQRGRPPSPVPRRRGGRAGGAGPVTATPPGWPDPPPELALGPRDVHVWRVALVQAPAILAALASTLADDERAGAARFYAARGPLPRAPRVRDLCVLRLPRSTSAIAPGATPISSSCSRPSSRSAPSPPPSSPSPSPSCTIANATSGWMPTTTALARRSPVVCAIDRKVRVANESSSRHRRQADNDIMTERAARERDDHPWPNTRIYR